MAYDVPGFMKRDGNSLIYTETKNILMYVIPEYMFNSACAQMYGANLFVLGVFSYIRANKDNGKLVDIRQFNFPTIISCKPSKIQKKVLGSNLNQQFGNKFDSACEYSIAIFEEGDVLINNVHTPQIIDNTEAFYKLFTISGKIPNTIPYDKIQDYYKKNINLNGSDYGVTAQLFGIIFSETCRDPDNPKLPFRNGKNIDKNLNSYKPVSIKETPNYIDPFVSITSEYFDESLMSAVLLKDSKHTPLERVMTD